jgi:hypothetical protein
MAKISNECSALPYCEHAWAIYPCYVLSNINIHNKYNPLAIGTSKIVKAFIIRQILMHVRNGRIGRYLVTNDSYCPNKWEPIGRHKIMIT